MSVFIVVVMSDCWLRFVEGSYRSSMVINEKKTPDSRGTYLLLNDTLKITGPLSKPQANLILDSIKIKVKIKILIAF